MTHPTADARAAAPSTPSTEQPSSYYRDLGDGRWESTRAAQGAWNEHEQHMAPVTGLLTRALLRHEPRPGLRLARIGCEILGLIPAGEFTIETTTLRPGRTIELVQAEMIAAGRPVVRATGWRLTTTDSTPVAGLTVDPLPGPGEAEPYPMTEKWGGGFIESLTGRVLPDHAPGRGRVWLTTDLALVQGEEPSPLEHLMGMADAANGVATRVHPAGGWIFPNVDLQLHLLREPVGRWLGLDVSVDFGTDGVGITSTALHDETGPFGRSLQILTLRELPGADQPTP
ncbi:thioesterase family protein [Tersicoccus solisilvae]|uniref:thioesterase family protein n=1 Tax=Tersicoccus solisilvae TaxID=1882339 RepID=UPI001E2856DC|nr:thioesterase family protein [Tersicoccus solisilvae]